MKSPDDIDRLSQTHSKVIGLAAGGGATVGAAVGGAYLAPESAGALQIAGGAVGCSLLSVLGVYVLTGLMGRQPVVVAGFSVLIAALTAMGGVAGYSFSGGWFRAAIVGAVGSGARRQRFPGTSAPH
jgi:hypothetical protein